MRAVFLFQPEYFRQSIHDLTFESDYFFHHISSGDSKTVSNGLEMAFDLKADVIFAFRPEWLAPHTNHLSQLKAIGTKIIGISTEPVPRDNQPESEHHPDQIQRLKNLLEANNVPLDLLVHYDSSSKTFLRRTVKHRLVFAPLPLSRRLFNTSSEDPKLKIFDSIFLGRSTDYRESFLNIPKSLHKHLHIAHGLTDELSANFIKQSKLSINIHNLPYSGYEVRVMQSLMCGVPVASQPLTRDDLNLSKGLSYFQTKEELRELILEAHLDNPITDEVHRVWAQQYDAKKWARSIIDQL